LNQVPFIMDISSNVLPLDLLYDVEALRLTLPTNANVEFSLNLITTYLETKVHGALISFSLKIHLHLITPKWSYHLSSLIFLQQLCLLMHIQNPLVVHDTSNCLM